MFFTRLHGQANQPKVEWWKGKRRSLDNKISPCAALSRDDKGGITNTPRLKSRGVIEFLESAAAGTATGTTTAWASATRTASRASRTTTAEAEGILTASKEVQTVDDMQHAVAGDGVVFGISAPHRRDGTAEGGLPVQDVVELQGDGEGLALKESL